MERKRVRKRNRSLTSNDALLPFSQKNFMSVFARSFKTIHFFPSFVHAER